MSVKTIETMAKWVEKNVTKAPTLKDMSSHVGYSPFYCSAKFREHMGMTYKQFLSQCRLRAAANDLLNTNDKITDIAFRYGYSSSESLTRAFALMFSCSPRQYRSRLSQYVNSSLPPSLQMSGVHIIEQTRNQPTPPQAFEKPRAN